MRETKENRSGTQASARAARTTIESGRIGLDCNRSLPSPIAMGSQVCTLQSKSAKRMGMKREMHAQKQPLRNVHTDP